MTFVAVCAPITKEWSMVHTIRVASIAIARAGAQITGVAVRTDTMKLMVGAASEQSDDHLKFALLSDLPSGFEVASSDKEVGDPRSIVIHATIAYPDGTPVGFADAVDVVDHLDLLGWQVPHCYRDPDGSARILARFKLAPPGTSKEDQAAVVDRELAKIRGVVQVLDYITTLNSDPAKPLFTLELCE